MTALFPLTSSAALFASQTFLAGLAEGAIHEAVLGPQAAEIQDMAQRSLKGEVAVSDVADRVWQRLAVDFGRSVPGCDVVERRDGTVEFYAAEREFEVFDPIDIPNILSWIDQTFEGALNLIERHGEDVIFRFPPLSRFEAGARRVFGAEAANWYIVNGEISRGHANQGHGERRQAVALPLKPHFLDQPGARYHVHGFIYGLHDVNHAVDVSGIHPELLKIAVALHESISALPPEFQATDCVQQQLHDLSELFRVREMTLFTFLERTFQPWKNEVRYLRHRMMASAEKARMADLYQRYVGLVFGRWLPLLSEDRRTGIASHQSSLERFAKDILSEP